MRARLLCVHTRTVGRTVQSHRAGSRVFARARVEHTGVHIPIIKESIYIHARTCVGVFVIGDRVYSHVARIYIHSGRVYSGCYCMDVSIYMRAE